MQSYQSIIVTSRVHYAIACRYIYVQVVIRIVQGQLCSSLTRLLKMQMFIHTLRGSTLQSQLKASTMIIPPIYKLCHTLALVGGAYGCCRLHFMLLLLCAKRQSTFKTWFNREKNWVFLLSRAADQFWCSLDCMIHPGGMIQSVEPQPCSLENG